MKYRIAETSGGFKIQYSLFGVFWFDYMTDEYRYGTWYWELDRYVVLFFDTLDEAKAELRDIKCYPLRYKGHKIVKGVFWDKGYKPVYVDKTVDYGFGYLIGSSERLNEVLDKIDAMVENEEKEARKRKILAVYKDK